MKIKQNITQIASRYGYGKCDTVAFAIRDHLIENGQHGEVIRLQWSEDKYQIWSDGLNRSVGNNGFHYGVLYDGMVYDNFYTAGIPYQQWLNDFVSTGTRTIIRTPF